MKNILLRNIKNILSKCRIVASLKNLLILLAFISIYAISLASISVLRFRALKANAWDLGNYNQALYTLVFHGKLFYYTPDIVRNPTGSLFGVHFSPILFLVVPVYYFYPTPECLLIFKVIFITIGGVLVYKISKLHRLPENISFFVLVSYLLNPFILGIIWFDFHPEDFMPTAILLTLYFFDKKNWLGLFTAFILALSTLEFTPIIMFVLSVIFFYETLHNPKLDRKRKSMAILLSIISIFWFLLSIMIIKSFNPEAPYLTSKDPQWSVLGASSVLDIPFAAMRNPMRVVEALMYDWSNKIAFLLILFSAFGFLPLLSPKYLLPAVPWLIVSLLSNYSVYYSIGLQYPSFLVPFFAYSMIKSICKLMTRFDKVV